ncbi:RpiB/LacA/LacB family sugar-phosphate isomerase [Candidatus Kaiserbacteria bacterium]|nr:RpiB/LacA/LacB family sugar-phosphate isomerase [Candidatus Kaiserbacteria bacterium]
MKVYLATDHAGFKLKESLSVFIRGLGYTVEDCGAFSYNEADDYPDFISEAAHEVSRSPEHKRAIILGGSGQGEAIVANRVSGVRAIVYYGGNSEIIKLGREHNNANILSLGARFISDEKAQEVVKIFLETPFVEDERHVRRLSKIS